MIAAIDWRPSYRLIRAHLPRVDIFERIVPPEDLAMLMEIEALTNPRMRFAIGPIAAIPVADRVTGPGASYVMAPFAYPSEARFSDEHRGAYYAAHDLATAIAEVSHHRAIFARTTPPKAMEFDERVVTARIAGDFEDLRAEPPGDPRYGEAYAAGQAFARDVRAGGGNGVVYTSVRHAAGECVGVFVPRLVRNARTERFIGLRWDGNAIVDAYTKDSLLGAYPK